jgi:hypothetical protein
LQEQWKVSAGAAFSSMPNAAAYYTLYNTIVDWKILADVD